MTGAASKTIMVVDDDPDIVLIFSKYLEFAGYSVVAFNDATEALEHLKSNAGRCSLIISDVRMPKMDGISFATKVWEIDPSIPFMFMSAFETNALRIAPGLNVAEFIQKPVSSSQLKQLVSKYMTVTAKQ